MTCIIASAIGAVAGLAIRYAWLWRRVKKHAERQALELGPGFKVKSVCLHPFRDWCHVVIAAPGTLESMKVDVTIGSVET